MIVLDEDDCMVDIAKFFMTFSQDESCGKCTPCREGTTRMLEILDRITTGKGTLEDLDKLERLAKLMKKSSLCGLGRAAPNPVLEHAGAFPRRVPGPRHRAALPGQASARPWSITRSTPRSASAARSAPGTARSSASPATAASRT